MGLTLEECGGERGKSRRGEREREIERQKGTFPLNTEGQTQFSSLYSH